MRNDSRLFSTYSTKKTLAEKSCLVSCFNQMENSDLKTLVSLQTEELYNEQQYTGMLRGNTSENT